MTKIQFRILFYVVFCALCSSLPAQTSRKTLAVNVDTLPSEGSSVAQNSTSVRLFLKNQELPVSSLDELREMPLQVVFVLDSSVHQRSVMPIALNYVTELATQIHSAQAAYTVLAATKKTQILVTANSSSELLSGLKKIDIDEYVLDEKSASLYAGVSEAVTILSTTSGAPVVVILADNDDDINAAALRDLKTEIAGAHVRCFVILLANHDFFGTKVQPESGTRLNSLANFSGGRRFETNWQNRRSDPLVLKKVAKDILNGGVITFTLPENLNIKPGIYRLSAKFGNHRTIRTSPVIIRPR